MMVVLFSGPLALLCAYLAYLCYRKAHYQHTLVLTLIAIFMAVLTLGVLGAGYFMGEVIKTEIALPGETSNNFPDHSAWSGKIV